MGNDKSTPLVSSLEMLGKSRPLERRSLIGNCP